MEIRLLEHVHKPTRKEGYTDTYVYIYDKPIPHFPTKTFAKTIFETRVSATQCYVPVIPSKEVFMYKLWHPRIP